MSIRRYSAFISYSHHYVEWVRILHKNLESCLRNAGEHRNVFRDEIDAGVGRSWVEQLQQGLHDTDALVLVATPESLASTRVRDEWQPFIDREQHRYGRLLVACLVDVELPSVLRQLQYVDFCNHDESRYRKGIQELVAAILGYHDKRRLPKLPDDFIIPSKPDMALPPELRRRIIKALVPELSDFKGRQGIAVTLSLEPPTMLNGFETPELAASAAVVLATRSQDALTGAKHIMGLLAQDVSIQSRDRFNTLLDEIVALGEKPRATPALLVGWLDHVRTEHEHFLPCFREVELLDLLDLVYVKLDLLPGVKSAANLREPCGLRGILAFDPEEHSWVTRRWVVRGDPGSGKTTLLRHLAWSLAGDEERSWVPVFESLPRLVRDGRWLLDRLEHRFVGLGYGPGLSAILEGLGREGKLILLLDGLDEVPREDRESAEDIVRRLASAWPSSPIIVTSRPIGYRSPASGFVELDLLPFDEERRRIFLEHWLGRHQNDLDAVGARRVLESLRSDRDLWELSGNPLYMTLMAMLLNEGKTLPRRRTELYDRVFDFLLEGRHRPEREPFPHRTSVVGAVRHLAYCMTKENCHTKPVECLEAFLFQDEGNVFRNQLEKVPGWRNLRNFLDDLSRMTGILGPVDGISSEWGFRHPTFREAFTSEYLEEQINIHGISAVLEHARGIAGDEGRWAEPYALLAGRVPDPDSLVQTLVEANSTLGLRAVATAQGLKDETLRKVLALTDEWKGRADVYRRIPDLVGEDRSLALLDRLRRRTTDGNDLYFLDLTVRGVSDRWPRQREAAGRLLDQFFDHIDPPDSSLFLDMEVGKGVDSWQEIPAGSFFMGSANDEGDVDERPRHEVVILRPFLLCRAPVTNAQYLAFDPGHEAERWPGVSDESWRHHPVENVTWFAAVSFCRWLSHYFGWAEGARLPTEEEWEYACRAGSKTEYWSGSGEESLANVGWYEANSNRRSHRVGKKRANPWGLFDTHGNVWEWTLSLHTDNYEGQEKGIKIDSPRISVGDVVLGGGNRVMKGGSSWFGADGARSAFRLNWPPEWHHGHCGFRVLLPSSSDLQG